MKKNIAPIILLFCLPMIGLWSCSKQLDKVAAVSDPSGFAFIKIGQYAPSFRAIVNNRDSFNLYVNSTKLNGSFMTFGSLFPTSNNLYAAVPSGTQTIRLTINGVNTPDSMSLVAFTKTLVAGNYYSFFLTDSLNSTDPSKQMFVLDNFSRTDTLHYTVRLVHSIVNDFGGNIDVYSYRLGANMFSNVSPASATAFASEPYTFTVDTLSVRRAGTLTELARLNSVIFARERAYTLLYKGGPLLTSGTKARALISFFNQ